MVQFISLSWGDLRETNHQLISFLHSLPLPHLPGVCSAMRCSKAQIARWLAVQRNAVHLSPHISARRLGVDSLGDHPLVHRVQGTRRNLKHSNCRFGHAMNSRWHKQHRFRCQHHADCCRSPTLLRQLPSETLISDLAPPLPPRAADEMEVLALCLFLLPYFCSLSLPDEGAMAFVAVVVRAASSWLLFLLLRLLLLLALAQIALLVRVIHGSVAAHALL